MSEEHLSDGRVPDLPVSDALLRRFLFNLAACNKLPAAAAGARILRRDEFTAADLGRPAAMHNAATLLRPLPFDRPGDTLDAVEEFFGGGRGEAYLWSAWPTSGCGCGSATGRPWPGCGCWRSPACRPWGVQRPEPSQRRGAGVPADHPLHPVAPPPARPVAATPS